MSTLDLELEIAGLKCRIAGERDDVFATLAQLHEQLSGLIELLPSSPNNSSTLAGANLQPPSDVAEEKLAKQNGSNKRPKGRNTPSSTRQATEPIEFRHDAEKFGFPKQEWNTATKAMWLLYILDQQTDTHEASAAVLAETFNKHFKHFGSILSFNVTRDLGRTKSKEHTVNSDGAKNPETWFLLASGKKFVEALLSENIGPSESKEIPS